MQGATLLMSHSSSWCRKRTDHLHMTSRRPYWWIKTKKWRPSWWTEISPRNLKSRLHDCQLRRVRVFLSENEEKRGNTKKYEASNKPSSKQSKHYVTARLHSLFLQWEGNTSKEKVSLHIVGTVYTESCRQSKCAKFWTSVFWKERFSFL